MLATLLCGLFAVLGTTPPLAAQDDVPDVLSDDGSFGLESVDLTTAPARAVVTKGGEKPLSLRVGLPCEEYLLVEAARTEIERRSRSTTSAVVIDAVAFDTAKRGFVGFGPRRLGAAEDPSLELVAVAIDSASARQVALVRTEDGDHVAGPGEAVGGLKVTSVHRELTRTLLIDAPDGATLHCRERVDVRERVELAPKPGRTPTTTGGPVTIQRHVVREGLREGPALFSPRQSLKLLSTLAPDRAVVSWRGEVRLARPGTDVGRWRLERVSRSQRPEGPGRQMVEQTVLARDLFSRDRVEFRIVDHFRDGRFESRDESQAEKRPVTLGAPGGADLPDLGM